MEHQQFTEEQAIEKAFQYLASKGKYMEQPYAPRLETIQRVNGEWVVVLSYLSKGQALEDTTNPLLAALNQVRKYKEFDIDAITGDVHAMTDPAVRR